MFKSIVGHDDAVVDFPWQEGASNPCEHQEIEIEHVLQALQRQRGLLVTIAAQAVEEVSQNPENGCYEDHPIDDVGLALRRSD